MIENALWGISAYMAYLIASCKQYVSTRKSVFGIQQHGFGTLCDRLGRSIKPRRYASY
ncbi:hypothetical protein KL86PLE_40602 [uncultured Pleomorphomonas sp.]|uniref:Uncharacterized protein n=1 Tax=uncultured Pleomorphomonas sp. TaxID=442121 RepID=A0A212LH51_9HYPH|nr:hypothetical protein KL86PLE_40602 [uncultured Pleomorphomonas sp.]